MKQKKSSFLVNSFKNNKNFSSLTWTKKLTTLYTLINVSKKRLKSNFLNFQSNLFFILLLPLIGYIVDKKIFLPSDNFDCFLKKTLPGLNAFNVTISSKITWETFNYTDYFKKLNWNKLKKITYFDNSIFLSFDSTFKLDNKIFYIGQYNSNDLIDLNQKKKYFISGRSFNRFFKAKRNKLNIFSLFKNEIKSIEDSEFSNSFQNFETKKFQNLTYWQPIFSEFDHIPFKLNSIFFSQQRKVTESFKIPSLIQINSFNSDAFEATIKSQHLRDIKKSKTKNLISTINSTIPSPLFDCLENTFKNEINLKVNLTLSENNNNILTNLESGKISEKEKVNGTLIEKNTDRLHFEIFNQLTIQSLWNFRFFQYKIYNHSFLFKNFLNFQLNQLFYTEPIKQNLKQFLKLKEQPIVKNYNNDISIALNKNKNDLFILDNKGLKNKKTKNLTKNQLLPEQNKDSTKKISNPIWTQTKHSNNLIEFEKKFNNFFSNEPNWQNWIRKDLRYFGNKPLYNFSWNNEEKMLGNLVITPNFTLLPSVSLCSERTEPYQRPKSIQKQTSMSRKHDFEPAFTTSINFDSDYHEDLKKNSSIDDNKYLIPQINNGDIKFSSLVNLENRINEFNKNKKFKSLLFLPHFEYKFFNYLNFKFNLIANKDLFNAEQKTFQAKKKNKKTSFENPHVFTTPNFYSERLSQRAKSQQILKAESTLLKRKMSGYLYPDTNQTECLEKFRHWKYVIVNKKFISNSFIKIQGPPNLLYLKFKQFLNNQHKTLEQSLNQLNTNLKKTSQIQNQSFFGGPISDFGLGFSPISKSFVIEKQLLANEKNVKKKNYEPNLLIPYSQIRTNAKTPFDFCKQPMKKDWLTLNPYYFNSLLIKKSNFYPFSVVSSLEQSYGNQSQQTLNLETLSKHQRNTFLSFNFKKDKIFNTHYQDDNYYKIEFCSSNEIVRKPIIYKTHFESNKNYDFLNGHYFQFMTRFKNLFNADLYEIVNFQNWTLLSQLSCFFIILKLIHNLQDNYKEAFFSAFKTFFNNFEFEALTKLKSTSGPIIKPKKIQFNNLIGGQLFLEEFTQTILLLRYARLNKQILTKPFGTPLTFFHIKPDTNFLKKYKNTDSFFYFVSYPLSFCSNSLFSFIFSLYFIKNGYQPKISMKNLPTKKSQKNTLKSTTLYPFSIQKIMKYYLLKRKYRNDKSKPTFTSFVINQTKVYKTLQIKRPKQEPKGFLLVGPPGTGKTLLVKTLSGESEVPIVLESGEKLSRLGLKNDTEMSENAKGALQLKTLFQRAKKMSPCILFLDEIDSVGQNRKDVLTYSRKQILRNSSTGFNSFYLNNNQQHSEDFNTLNSKNLVTLEIKQNKYWFNPLFTQSDSFLETTTQFESDSKVSTVKKKSTDLSTKALSMLTQLLCELDGVKNRQDIVVIGATNRPTTLDPALTRPGRLSQIIYIDLPGKQKRLNLLKFYATRTNSNLVNSNINWEFFANQTAGLSAAHICSAINLSMLKTIYLSFYSKKSRISKATPHIYNTTFDYSFRVNKQSKDSLENGEKQVIYDAFAPNLFREEYSSSSSKARNRTDVSASGLGSPFKMLSALYKRSDFFFFEANKSQSFFLFSPKEQKLKGKLTPKHTFQTIEYGIQTVKSRNSSFHYKCYKLGQSVNTSILGTTYSTQLWKFLILKINSDLFLKGVLTNILINKKKTRVIKKTFLPYKSNKHSLTPLKISLRKDFYNKHKKFIRILYLITNPIKLKNNNLNVDSNKMNIVLLQFTKFEKNQVNVKQKNIFSLFTNYINRFFQINLFGYLFLLNSTYLIKNPLYFSLQLKFLMNSSFSFIESQPNKINETLNFKKSYHFSDTVLKYKLLWYQSKLNNVIFLNKSYSPHSLKNVKIKQSVFVSKMPGNIKSKMYNSNLFYKNTIQYLLFGDQYLINRTSYYLSGKALILITLKKPFLSGRLQEPLSLWLMKNSFDQKTKQKLLNYQSKNRLITKQDFEKYLLSILAGKVGEIKMLLNQQSNNQSNLAIDEFESIGWLLNIMLQKNLFYKPFEVSVLKKLPLQCITTSLKPNTKKLIKNRTSVFDITSLQKQTKLLMNKLDKKLIVRNSNQNKQKTNFWNSVPYWWEFDSKLKRTNVMILHWSTVFTKTNKREFYLTKESMNFHLISSNLYFSTLVNNKLNYSFKIKKVYSFNTSFLHIPKKNNKNSLFSNSSMFEGSQTAKVENSSLLNPLLTNLNCSQALNTSLKNKILTDYQLNWNNILALQPYLLMSQLIFDGFNKCFNLFEMNCELIDYFIYYILCYERLYDFQLLKMSDIYYSKIKEN